MNPQYDWQKPYMAAILEPDNSKVKDRIEEARLAIAARVEELSNDHMGTPEERAALQNALRLLGVLSDERS